MLSKRQVHASVREAVRRSCYLARFKKADYESTTFQELLDLLDLAIGYEVRREKERLLTLNVSIRRACRIKGYSVKVPEISFYKKKSRRTESITAIADFILAAPMKPVPTKGATS